MSTLPEGWSRKSLGEVAEVTSGGTPDRKNELYWGGSIPWVTTGEINFNIISATREYITEAGLKASSAKLLPIGTVLMAMYGQGMTRGRVAILSVEGAVNQNCAAIKAGPQCDHLYLYHYLAHNYDNIRSLSHYGGVDHLNNNLVRNIILPLPPLAEQRKIAAILGAWDEAIAAAERLVATLRERKRGLMQRLLTERVRFPEFAGRAWQERELRECVEPVSRIAKVQPGQHYNLVGVRWYLEGAHIHDTVSGDNVVTQALSRIHENDILYNKMWVTKAAFAIAKAEHHGAYGTSEYPTFTAKSNLDVRYLEYAFHDPRFLHEARALCRGTTGRARLNPDDFLKLKLLLPDREEQTKIANVLETAQQESDHAQRHVIALKEQKRGLMQRLLTGQVRVQVDEEQPA